MNPCYLMPMPYFLPQLAGYKEIPSLACHIIGFIQMRCKGKSELILLSLPEDKKAQPVRHNQAEFYYVNLLPYFGNK